jgi:hypothetical protein
MWTSIAIGVALDIDIADVGEGTSSERHEANKYE